MTSFDIEKCLGDLRIMIQTSCLNDMTSRSHLNFYNVRQISYKC